MTSDAQDHPIPPLQAVLYPACTEDYRVTASGKHGYGIVANRKIKKGEAVYGDSLEYSFSDVSLQGDCLLLDRHKKASHDSKLSVSHYYSIDRETLLKTHGVPNLIPDPTGQTAGTASWLLEVPGMLMNHSCDPNMIDYPPSTETGDGYAARDIEKGEELTCDYCLYFYDRGALIEKCECGSKNCRGSMMGFKALSDADKERLYPATSMAVKAMYNADLGKGPPVKIEQLFPERVVPSPDEIVPRVVFPGPSYQAEDIDKIRTGEATPAFAVKRDEDSGEFGLFAMRHYSSGEKVYEYWRQSWPVESNVVDMVFAKQVNEGDPPEGTIIRFNALERATRNRGGQRMFSGWDMLTKHSCDPNLVYSYYDWDKEEDWCRAYAAKDINPGDQLTVDFNCLFWDRSDCIDLDLDTCECGSPQCTGSVKGFKFLPRETKDSYKMLSWKHMAPPYEGSGDKVHPGEALAPYVRVQWRKSKEFRDDAPATDDESSSSSSDSE